MRISLNWLKDYLEIKPDLDVDQIGESLTLAGLEVEGIERIGLKAREFSLGTITSVLEVKESQTVYELSARGENVVVSGASSLDVGMVVAFKDNMVAHYSDLGFDKGTQEVLAFPRDYFEGDVPDDLSEVKDFDDVIFTLGITPNRADALSHLGVSRELSALLEVNARSPMLTPKEMAGLTHERVAIEINNTDDCPRYACRVVESIKIKESPLWLKLRLMSVGLRPINNVVDVTNYVMLSRGQPMHAFDYDTLENDNQRAKIIVRRARADEPFTTLDGNEIRLNQDDVVIADPVNTLALAGVIGGLKSAVTEQTTTVLLESAYFDPKNVRMTARRHGLITDSSYRFERGCDPNGVVDALNFAARLLTEITDAKVCREVIDAYRKRIDPTEIKMRPERAQAVLGLDAIDFDQEKIRRRFLRLGIETVAKRGDAIYFRVPTYRSDLSREIDLIEEAARMIGYDKVKESIFFDGAPAIFGFTNKREEDVCRRIRTTLASLGFSEAINYAFLSKELQDRFVGDDADKVIEVKNPLSDRYGVMRISLIPGLVKNLLHNQRNQEKSIALFEMGTIFLGKREQGARPTPSALSGQLFFDSFSHEKQSIAGVVAGRCAYNAFDMPASSFDFYHVKGMLTEVLANLSLSDRFPARDIKFEHGCPRAYFHPGESSTIVDAKSRALGWFGKLHPELASVLEVSGHVYLFELDLEAIANNVSEVTKYKPFSRYPTIERDVAFLVDEAIVVGDIIDAVETIDDANNTVTSIRVFDIYRGKNIDAGKKSVAIALSLQRQDRTLTDEEADGFMNDYIAAVGNKTGAKVRGI